jgi:hypothetical protein
VKYLWLLLMLWAGAAHGRTWTLSHNDSLTAFNAGAVAGDVGQFTAGTYTVPIEPAHNGTADTSTGRIRYVGRLDNYGATVSVPIIKIYRRYITVLGVKSRASVDLYCETSWDATHGSWSIVDSTKIAYHDSVAYCTAIGGLNLLGAKNSVVYKSKFGGNLYLEMNNGYAHTYQGGNVWVGGVVNCAYDVVRQCNFDLGNWSQKACYLRGYVQYCVIDSNRFTGTFTASLGADNAYGRYIYQSYYNTFKDNYWKFEATNALAPVPLGTTHYDYCKSATVADTQWSTFTAFAMRDSTHDNLFLRDTMLLGLNSTSTYPLHPVLIGGKLGNGGVQDWVGQLHHNRWSQCYYLMTEGANIYEKFIDSAIDSSVFASKWTSPIYCDGQDITRSRLYHNSFWSFSEPSVRMVNGSHPFDLTIRKNIFFVRRIHPDWLRGGCMHYDIDAPIAPAQSDSNLFYATAVDGANSYCNGQTYTVVQPYGFNNKQFGATPGGPYCHGPPYIDCTTAWGNPAWTDTTFATLNPQIADTSPASGAQWGSEGYVGARNPKCSAPGAVAQVAVDTLGSRNSNGAQTFKVNFPLPADASVCMPDSYLVVVDTTGCTVANLGALISFVGANPYGQTPGAYWGWYKPTELWGEWQECSGVPAYYGANAPPGWSVLVFGYTRNPVSGTGWTNYTAYHRCPS